MSVLSAINYYYLSAAEPHLKLIRVSAQTIWFDTVWYDVDL